MIINDDNGRIINTKDVYLHDSVFNYFVFDKFKSNIHIWATTEDETRDYTIKFIDVIGFEMSSCAYWGPSMYIFDFEYVEHVEILLKSFVKRSL